jgi:hypothetical protein
MKYLMIVKCNTHQETTEVDPDTEMMQSVEEHQEFPIGEAVVMPVKRQKKRRKGRKSTAGRRGEPKELTRGNCGSRRKLAVACRKVSRHAKVAWRKRNLIRQLWTEVNCGPRKELAVAGMRTTRRATVAWSRENFVRKDWTRNQAGQGTPKPRKDGKRLWKGQEFNDSLREGLRQQPRSEIGIKDPDTRRQLRLRIKRTSDRIDGNTFRLEMVKRANEMSSGLREIRKWTLWRGRPHPKRKKELQVEEELAM